LKWFFFPISGPQLTVVRPLRVPYRVQWSFVDPVAFLDNPIAFRGALVFFPLGLLTGLFSAHKWLVCFNFLATEYKQKSKKSKEIKYLHVDFITDNKFT
jgi:hypothetical protein